MSDLLRDLARAKAVFQLRAIEAIIHDAPASADTRPQGGDSTQIEAPFTSGAVAKPDAQPLIPTKKEQLSE